MSVMESQKRMRRLAKLLSSGSAINSKDRKFLSDALSDIADGIDANKALGVKAKRGERKSKQARIRKATEMHAMAWIAAARLPAEHGGLGLSLEEACALASNKGTSGGFFLTEETLRSYWNKKPRRRRVIFKQED